MRISGLASGMDTDSIVESMMKVERMKVDRFEQSKQLSMWRQEAYNDTNKSFANFILNTKKDLGLNKTSNTGVITSNSYKNLDYVRSTTSSDESKIGVSASSKAVNGSYSIDVKNLATGASFASADMKGKEDIIKDGMKFSINGETITVNKSGTDISMEDVVKAINSATKTETVPATGSQPATSKQVPLGVSAFYDKSNGRLFIQTDSMGEDAKIELGQAKDKDGNLIDPNGLEFIKALGYKIDSVGENEKENGMSGGEGAKYTSGKKAQIEFNGITLEYNSNNIELNGISMQLKDVGKVNVNVATNIDGMMEKIEKFVEDYNKLIDETSKTLGEKQYRGFHPLSQEEKKAMHEDDVKLWMEKSKSGMLNKDENINRTMQSIRSHIYKTVEFEGDKPAFTQITQIGISTERWAQGSSGGKLEIDAEKLRKALTDDPEAVMDLLFKDGEFDKDGKEILTDSNKTTMGIFTGIYNKLTDGMKSIIDKSGPGENAPLYRNVKSNLLLDFVTRKSSISDIDKAIMDMDKKIGNLNALLDRKEDAYYAKFTQMEKYMYKMNNQSGWLAQQFM